MFERIKKTITSKSKAEWRDLAANYWYSGRSWVQEHGELALLLGLAVGFGVVFIYKFLFILSLMAILCGAVVWHLAPSERHAADDSQQPPNDL